MRGSAGGVYRIHDNQGPSYNVRAMGDEHAVTLLCAYPPGVPLGDVLLAQKLALETDEPGFLATANHRRL